MNILRKNVLLILLMLILACTAEGCENSSAEGGSEAIVSNESIEAQEESEFVFYGSVIETESDFGGILVKPESDTLPNELVVHSSEMPELSVGDRVKVEYGGQITLSMPAQIFGAKVTLSE